MVKNFMFMTLPEFTSWMASDNNASPQDSQICWHVLSGNPDVRRIVNEQGELMLGIPLNPGEPHPQIGASR